MSRVFVVNYEHTKHDLADANKYTTEPFIYLTEGFVEFDSATVVGMARRLRSFTDRDFLILSGTAALVATAIAILKETNKIGSIHVLLYDKRKNRYLPRIINGKMEFASD